MIPFSGPYVFASLERVSKPGSAVSHYAPWASAGHLLALSEPLDCPTDWAWRWLIVTQWVPLYILFHNVHEFFRLSFRLSLPAMYPHELLTPTHRSFPICSASGEIDVSEEIKMVQLRKKSALLLYQQRRTKENGFTATI